MKHKIQNKLYSLLLLSLAGVMAITFTAQPVAAQVSLPFQSGLDAKDLFIAREGSNLMTQNLAGKNNAGADKNGPGTASLTKNGLHGVSSYVDSAGDKMRLDFTHPDSKRRPVIIFVHGGGWRADDGNYRDEFRARAAQNGFASFRVTYKLGPNRIYSAYNDIMNVITHVRNNADTYNIDPARILLWGDSAGGSLTARVAASGKSGIAGGICWSAPTNAIRDLMHSHETMLAGLDHSTCLNTAFTSIFTDIAELWRGQEYLFQDPSKIASLSLDEQVRLAESTAKTLGIVGTKLPTAVSQLKQTFSEWGIDINRLTKMNSVGRNSSNLLGNAANKLDPAKANSQTNLPANNSDLQEFKDTLRRVSKDLGSISDDSPLAKNVQADLDRIVNDLPAKPGETGNITLEEAKAQVLVMSESLKTASNSRDHNDKNSMIYQLIQSTQKDPSKKAQTPASDDDILRAWISTMPDSEASQLNNFMGIMRTVSTNDALTDEQKSTLGPLQDLVSKLSNGSQQNSLGLGVTLNGNSKNIIINKLGECIDNLIHMSPSVFAHPATPPMFMANGEYERITPAGDAYEMRDKVRSFGTRGDALIIPGDVHMGYDERAVEPSFAFARSLTNPEPVGQ